jgi:hypothetical protein
MSLSVSPDLTVYFLAVAGLLGAAVAGVADFAAVRLADVSRVAAEAAVLAPVDLMPCALRVPALTAAVLLAEDKASRCCAACPWGAPPDALVKAKAAATPTKAGAAATGSQRVTRRRRADVASVPKRVLSEEFALTRKAARVTRAGRHAGGSRVPASPS